MSEQSTVAANQEVITEFLMELCETINERHTALEKRIDDSLSVVANDASDLRRIQLVHIDGALQAFRGNVIQFCLGGGETKNG